MKSILVSNYIFSLISSAHLFLNLVWHIDQAKAIEHSVDVGHSTDVSKSLGSIYNLSNLSNIFIS